MRRNGDITPEMRDVLKRSGSRNQVEAIAAGAELSEIFAAVAEGRAEAYSKLVTASASKGRVLAMDLPIRQGLMSGDLITPIFEQISFQPNDRVEIPLDLLVPGTEGEFNAYAIPYHGRPSSYLIEADYVKIPTYMIGNSMGWTERIAQEANWDIVGRALEVAEAGLVKKKNDDGFHVIIGAGAARNAVIYDSAAAQGQFTTRLVSLLKTYVRRNGGGNTSSVNRFKLTHLYVSPEAIDSMRSWGLDQIDEITRREIYVMDDGSVNRVYQVNLVDIDELGVGQEYQLYFTNDLGGTLGTGGGHTDVELVIGLDLQSSHTSFVMPVVGGVDMREDITAHFELRRRFRWLQEIGFACLDNRKVILGSF